MVLRSFPAAEIADMVVDGVITVTCEFCNTHYRFAPGDLDPR
jgi:molecular chaperone Hsp33